MQVLNSTQKAAFFVIFFTPPAPQPGGIPRPGGPPSTMRWMEPGHFRNHLIYWGSTPRELSGKREMDERH